MTSKNVRQRGAAWQADITVAGRRMRKDFPTEAEAQAWVDANKAKVKQTAPNQRSSRARSNQTSGSGITFGEATELTFARYWAGGKHEGKQRGLVDRVLADIGKETALSDIDTFFLDTYVMDMRRWGKGSATINHRLSVVSRVLKFAAERGHEVPRYKIEREKLYNERLGFLTPDEEARILAFTRQWGKDDHTDVITCLIDTGMRHGELFVLTDKDVTVIEREDGTRTASIRINKSLGEGAKAGRVKNGQERVIYATSRVLTILERRMSVVREGGAGNGRLFPFNNQWLRQVWDRIRGIMGRTEDKNFVSYLCRHTCASRMVQKHIPLPVIQKWMGHKTIQMTMRYAKLAPAQMDEAARIMDGIGAI